MNALNDQQTAEAAATILNNIASSPTISTSRTITRNNYANTCSPSNQTRNAQTLGCDSQTAETEMTPFLYIQPPPPDSTNNTSSDNNNLPMNEALLINGPEDRQEEGLNVEDESNMIIEESNVMSNVIV